MATRSIRGTAVAPFKRKNPHWAPSSQHLVQLSPLYQVRGTCVAMQWTADEIENRRLILNLFRTTGQRLDWQGTIEELTTTEIRI